MKKTILVQILFFAGFFIQAQVGINTDTPQATLDVTGKPTDNTVLDGIIPPRLTGVQLRSKTYTVTQTGAMVYVTAADTSPAGQTIDVISTGYFYFDGTKWVAAGAAVEQDGVIGNEVLNSTTNGGLTRAGAGTTVSPYTLGLTSGTTAGQLMTWNGTQWLPSAAINIYNSNGTLTSNRTLNQNGLTLTFTNGTGQSTLFRNDSGTGISQRAASGGRASMVFSDFNNAGALWLIADTNSASQLQAIGNSTQLVLGTTSTATAAPITFITSTGSNATGVEKVRITPDGKVGIGISSPAVTLDVAGLPATTTVFDGIRAPNITGVQLRAKTYTTTHTGAMVYVTNADTAPAGQTIDVTAAGYYYFNGTKWVSSGVAQEVDGIVGNEVTNGTTNGGLTRAGAGTQASPYTLGLTSGTTAGQLMTWNGTQWLPSAAINIYNADGTLTNNRTVTLGDKTLTFNNTYQQTVWGQFGGIIQAGLNSSPYNVGSFQAQAPDHNGNGVTSNLYIQAYSETSAQVLAGEDATSLNIGTHFTTNPAPINFLTTSASNVTGTTKATITGAGNMGINIVTPTEKFDLAGIARIRTLPLNGATNAINTTPAGNASASQNQTFTATKTVVADANGVLGYIDGPPFYQNIRGNVTAVTGGYSVAATDYLIVTNVASGGSTITFPNLTAADAGRTVQIFNNNSSGAANTLVGTTTILGQIGNNAQRGRTLIWTGSVWVSIGL